MACHSAVRTRGFSLIELVVVMLIASILAAIAIPGYSNYVRKSRRTEAKTALLDLVSLEERYYSAQNIYATDPPSLGYPGASFPQTIGSSYYQMNVPNVTPATAPTQTSVGQPAVFTLTAVAINDQVKDTSCQVFVVTSAGGQSSQDASGNDTTATCWR